MSRARKSESVAVVDTAPLLEQMGRLLSEIGKINMQLPITSPARAGLKTISSQMKEVATIITKDPDYFSGKAPSMQTWFRPGS